MPFISVHTNVIRYVPGSFTRYQWGVVAFIIKGPPFRFDIVSRRVVVHRSHSAPLSATFKITVNNSLPPTNRQFMALIVINSVRARWKLIHSTTWWGMWASIIQKKHHKNKAHFSRARTTSVHFSSNLSQEAGVCPYRTHWRAQKYYKEQYGISADGCRISRAFAVPVLDTIEKISIRTAHLCPGSVSVVCSQKLLARVVINGEKKQKDSFPPRARAIGEMEKCRLCSVRSW